MEVKNKLNIKVIVSDINGDEILTRSYGTDHYDEQNLIESISKQLEDSDEYICDDCWNTGEVDYVKCHCKLENN